MTPSSFDWKKHLRPIAPRLVRRAWQVLFGWRWFRGRYATWAEAQKQSVGYDEPGILNRVLQATLEVKAGRAAYERDGVLFHEPAVEPDLLASMEQIAAENGGRLRVLDFGGSLGTTYWQHRARLGHLTDLRWDIVEQPHFVRVGRERLEDETLRFYSTVEEAEADRRHDVLLASGVVHCLPAPHAFLEATVARQLPYLLLHNLPLHEEDPDYLMVEHVPPEIYAATYPVWFFNRAGFLAHFASRYEVVRSYSSTAVWPVGWRMYPSSGLLLHLKP